ncbi:protein YIPF5-like, partial [Rhagoletis pomonella]
MSYASGTNDPNDFYASGGDQSYNFEVPEFGQELNFQTFDNTQSSVPPSYDASYAASNQGLSGFYDPNAYVNQSYDQDSGFKPGGTGTDFDDEPPLLEELGINPQHIFLK